MAKKYSEAFSIIGVANTTTFDAGLASTESEQRMITRVFLHVSGQIGNIILANIEREKIMEFYDYLIETDETTGSTNQQKSVHKINEVEIGHDLPVGRTFKIGIKCGSTQKDVYGSYEYELK